MPISSLQVEKHTLSGLIKHPQTFPEVAPFLTEKEFFDEVHSTIFLIIRSCFDKNEKWDKVLLAEKIKNLGVSFKNEINIYDYIDNLSFIPITIQATIDSAKELIKLRIRRDLETMAEQMKKFVRESGNASLDEIVGGIDGIYGQRVSLYTSEDQPQNLYGGIESMVIDRSNNPIEETGVKTPYSEFNRLYGGLKPGQIYAIASRPGQGKSTWIEDICIKSCQINDIKAFICDTEMSTEDIRWRAAAAKSGVPQWYVETGQWRKNVEMDKKMRKALAEIKVMGDQNYVTHYHVGNKNLDQVISMIRRWYYANVKPGAPCIIAYDYLKLTLGENVEKNWGEYQVLGEKIDRLKRLAEELNCIIITAIQLNRSGENHNRQSSTVSDDSSAIAISDRLQWFAAFVAIFRRKTLDEIALDGEEFGSHKLIPLKTRFQGKDAAGHHDLVRRTNEDGDVKYVNNYLNFNVDNFDVSEMGSLRDIVAQQSERVNLDDQNTSDGRTL
jgi:replicative DNA helicase